MERVHPAKGDPPSLFLHNPSNPQAAQEAIEALEHMLEERPDATIAALCDPMLLTEVVIRPEPEPERVAFRAVLRGVVTSLFEQAGTKTGIIFGFDEATRDALAGDPVAQAARTALFGIHQAHPAARMLREQARREELRVYCGLRAAYLRRQRAVSAA